MIYSFILNSTIHYGAKYLAHFLNRPVDTAIKPATEKNTDSPREKTPETPLIERGLSLSGPLIVDIIPLVLAFLSKEDRLSFLSSNRKFRADAFNRERLHLILHPPDFSIIHGVFKSGDLPKAHFGKFVLPKLNFAVKENLSVSLNISLNEYNVDTLTNLDSQRILFFKERIKSASYQFDFNNNYTTLRLIYSPKLLPNLTSIFCHTPIKMAEVILSGVNNNVTAFFDDSISEINDKITLLSCANICDNSKLTVSDFPKLSLFSCQSIAPEANVTLSNLPGLTSLSFQHDIDGHLHILNMSKLQSLDFANIGPNASITIENASELKELKFCAEKIKSSAVLSRFKELQLEVDKRNK